MQTSTNVTELAEISLIVWNNLRLATSTVKNINFKYFKYNEEAKLARLGLHEWKKINKKCTLQQAQVCSWKLVVSPKNIARHQLCERISAHSDASWEQNAASTALSVCMCAEGKAHAGAKENRRRQQQREEKGESVRWVRAREKEKRGKSIDGPRKLEVGVYVCGRFKSLHISLCQARQHSNRRFHSLGCVRALLKMSPFACSEKSIVSLWLHSARGALFAQGWH